MNHSFKLGLSILAITYSCFLLFSCRTTTNSSKMLGADTSSSQAASQPIDGSKKKMVLMNFQRQQSQ